MGLTRVTAHPPCASRVHRSPFWLSSCTHHDGRAASALPAALPVSALETSEGPQCSRAPLATLTAVSCHCIRCPLHAVCLLVPSHFSLPLSQVKLARPKSVSARPGSPSRGRARWRRRPRALHACLAMPPRPSTLTRGRPAWRRGASTAFEAQAPAGAPRARGSRASAPVSIHAVVALARPAAPPVLDHGHVCAARASWCSGALYLLSSLSHHGRAALVAILRARGRPRARTHRPRARRRRSAPTSR